jgi:prevent-host-death family protein
MTSVGTIEVKRYLTELLGRVGKGERILITNRGQPVAMLVPAEFREPQDAAAVVEEMLRARDEGGPMLGKRLSVRRMIEEGRRL